MKISTIISTAVFGALVLVCVPFALAETATAELSLATAEGSGKSIGSVTFTDTANGLEIKTQLSGLPAGEHGFHIHENGTCAPAESDGKMTPAQAAGGHYDPDNTGKHLGPDGGGHKGDLPVLVVDANGEANHTMLVKTLTAAEIKDRALMVHAGGDNYSDEPVELGGGGARLACGVIH